VTATVALVSRAALAALPVDVSGSYAGTISSRNQTPSTASGALTQTGRSVAGTIVLELTTTDQAGAYQVTGKTSGRRVRVSGTSSTGARLFWRGIVKSGVVAGTARVRSAQGRLAGKLILTRNDVTGATATSCDAVYAQNQSFFDVQVMGQVLTTCAQCHTAGGQAQATRLRVTPADPLATARSTTLLVDRANPSASRLIEKPLAILPHGGGQQIVAGSPREAILRQWIDLVAQASCTGSGGPSGPGDVYVQSCASCHGADATGAAGAPDIRCSVPSRVVDAVRRGRGAVMPAFSTTELGGADVQHIESYLAGLCTGAPADVFASNCATCHGATAGGGRNADGVRGPNVRCSESSDFFEAVRFGSEGMPAFGDLGRNAVTQLASYVRSLCTLGGGGND
jgi:mono/diheme cytochrome c family protein